VIGLAPLSLGGTDRLYDHYVAHFAATHQRKGPSTHQDSVIIFRENYFDIRLSFLPANTPLWHGAHNNHTDRAASCTSCASIRRDRRSAT